MNKPAAVFQGAIRQTQGGLSQGSNGEGWIIQIDIPEAEATPELITELMRMRREPLVVTIMKAGRLAQQAASQSTKEKPSKGPYGEFWRQAEAKGLFSHPDLQEWLLRQESPEDATEAEVIRKAFGVASRAEISPEALLARLEQDLPAQSVAGLRITIERMAAKAAQDREQV